MSAGRGRSKPGGTVNWPATGRKGEVRGWRSHGPDLCQRVFAADDEERFAGLDAAEEGEKVTLNVLDADGTHGVILTAAEGRTNYGT